ncbi:MAG: dTMP kinase [bacterium]
MEQKGLFITFEGSEACGKSTQIKMLAERLSSLKIHPLILREPGGTEAGEVIRHLLQHAPQGEALTPEAELLLFAASRAQLVREKILPALAADGVVICDRFLDSTTVYQGVARRIPAGETDRINSFAVGDCLPDITFLLDLDPEVSFSRMKKDSRMPDRIERESVEFFNAVRSGYLALASQNPHRIQTLDASRPAEHLAEEIFKCVQAAIERKTC